MNHHLRIDLASHVPELDLVSMTSMIDTASVTFNGMTPKSTLLQTFATAFINALLCVVSLFRLLARSYAL